MNRYQFMKQLGDGTYGSVILATVNETGEKVAIKKMKKKYYSWEECLNLREVKSLRKLNHSNIVKLKEVIRENDMLYFVFEYMKENLYQMTKDRDKLFPESVVRNITYQVLQGLTFMHKHGYFHRDLKPENLLCNGPDLIKVADFGLARETRSRPPYTDYVSTRWYRAPEVLLRSTNYNSPIDIWAIGCIMAEVYTLRPLFPGNSEIDQLFKVCAILGTPSKAEWPEGHKLAAAMNFRWPQTVPTPLKQLIPNASPDGLQLLRDMLLWAPEKRPTAAQALRYSFFKVGGNLGQQSAGPPPIAQPVKQQPQPVQAVPSAPKKDPFENKTTLPNVNAKQPFAPVENKTILPSVEPNVPQKPALARKESFSFGQAQKKSASRRRWGGNAGAAGDSMDDFLNDLDLSVSIKKPMAPSPVKAVPTKKRNSVFDDFDDDDLFSSGFAVSKNNGLPKIGAANNRLNSGRSSAGSAKQVYMSKSRYVPGKRINSGKKENGFGKGNPIAPIGNNFGQANTFGNNNARKQSISKPLDPSPFTTTRTTANYVPSFSGSASGNKTNYRAGPTWKKAEPLAPLAKPTGIRQPVGGATGRTDWASKYLKS